MVKELAERSALASSAAVCERSATTRRGGRGTGQCLRLGAVDGVKGLVEEEAYGPTVVDPWRAILVKGRVVPQEGEKVGNDEREAAESDGVGRHRHGEAFDDDIGVEGLEDVF